MSEKFVGAGVETSQEEKAEFTQEMLEHNLQSDYPNNSFNRPYMLIEWVLDGDMTMDQFFEKVTPEKILTVEEYIDEYTEKRDLIPVEITIPELQEQIRLTNEYVFRLRELLTKRAGLQEIYDLCREYAVFSGNQRKFHEMDFTNYKPE